MQVLGECGIGPYFECVVSGEQFARSKPDPEIYRFVMRQMGMQPDECLVVEDSTYGVQAGYAAGVYIAALRDTRFPFDQSLADFHIESLDEIPHVLTKLRTQELHRKQGVPVYRDTNHLWITNFSVDQCRVS